MRRLAVLVIAGLLAVPLAAGAQPIGGVRTIGLMGTSAGAQSALKDTLRQLGWIEGQTVRFEGRFSADYRSFPAWPPSW